jgi:hypothetical protein
MALGFRSPMYFCLDLGWWWCLRVDGGGGDRIHEVDRLSNPEKGCLLRLYSPERSKVLCRCSYCKPSCRSPSESPLQDHQSSLNAAESQVEVIQLVLFILLVHPTPSISSSSIAQHDRSTRRNRARSLTYPLVSLISLGMVTS